MNRFVLLSLTALAFLPAVSFAKEPRIMGGEAAPAGAYPWMAAVVDKNITDNWQAQYAGGSLIHPRWILTAAHVVEGVKAADVQVIVGAPDLDAAGLQRINVLEIVRHPSYVTSGFDFDVALLLLETPVTGVAPLEIISDAALAVTDTPATVLGWGSLSEAEDDFGTAILQRVVVPIVDQDLANSASWHNGALTPNMLAAGAAEGGKDSCSGDSGGPLVVQGGSGQWVQAGIVSWGEGCGVATKPGVYTRLSKFRQWIQSFVWPDFYAWEVANGVDNDDGPDVDSDGAAQWTEYAFASNPQLAFDAPALLLGGSGSQAGQFYPTLTLRRPAAGGNVFWGLEQSANLTNWTALTESAQRVGAVAVPGNTSLEDMTWRGAPGGTASFLRAAASPGRDYYSAKRSLTFPGTVTHGLHTGDTLSGGLRTRDYSLSGLPAGQSVSLTLRSSSFNSVLQLVNADTGVVITNSSTNTGGNSTDEKITFPVDSAVRYVARVTTQTAGATGEFTLSLFQLRSGLPTLGAAQTVSGSLTPSDPVDPFYPNDTYYADDFVFTSTTGAAVTLFQTSQVFDPDFAVINAETGERLYGAGGFRVQNGYSLSAMQTFLPRAGVPYYVRVSSAGIAATGNYTLRSAAVTTAPTGTIRNGTFSTTDGVDPYWVPDYAILADDYILTGATPGVARTISATSTPVDMVLEVLDAESGASVAFNDDLAEGVSDSEIVFTPVAGHTYIIRVSGYDEFSTGAYTLEVQ